MTAFRKNECELRRTVEKSQKATTAQSAKPKAPVGLVTLFCDVSYCPTTKAAGWGAWYRTDAMEKGAFFGSVVPMPCENSNDGEFWGLVLALRGIFSRLGADRPDAIVLQCDNLSALSWIRQFHPNAHAVGDHHGTHSISNPPKSYPREMETAIAVARDMDPSVRIWLKHVKGHDKKTTARSWVNKKCDELARKYRPGRPPRGKTATRHH